MLDIKKLFVNYLIIMFILLIPFQILYTFGYYVRIKTMKMKQEDEESITVCNSVSVKDVSQKGGGGSDVEKSSDNESVKPNIKIADVDSTHSEPSSINSESEQTEVSIITTTVTATITTTTNGNNNQTMQNNGQSSQPRKYTPSHHKSYTLNHNASPWTPTSMTYSSQPQHHSHHHRQAQPQISLPLQIPPPPNHLNQHLNLNLSLPTNLLPPPPPHGTNLPQQNPNNLPPGIGMGIPAIPTSPLPTALFPLPFDPNYPPAVLPATCPSYNGQSSGYSTAGHSISSSPVPSSMMMAPNQYHGSGLLMTACSASNDKLGHSSSSCSSSNRSSPNPNIMMASSTNTTTSTLSEASSKSGSVTNSSKSLSPSSSNCVPAGSGSHYQQQHLGGSSCASYSTSNSNVCPNIVLAAPSKELTVYSHFPTVPGQHVVYFHINPGVSVSFPIGDQVQIIQGKRNTFYALCNYYNAIQTNC